MGPSVVCLCVLQLGRLKLLNPYRGIGTRGDALDGARKGEHQHLATCNCDTLGGHSSGGSAIDTSQREVGNLGGVQVLDDDLTPVGVGGDKRAGGGPNGDLGEGELAIPLSSLYVDPGRRCPRVGTVRRGGTSRDCATYALGLSDPSVSWISISSKTSGGTRQKPRAPLQGMGLDRGWGFSSTKL